MELTETEIAQIHNDAYNWEQNRLRKDSISQLFTKEGIDYDLIDFTIPKRCFLWLKTLVCLLLNRTGASYMDKNYFCILSFNERYDMCGSGWDACWISSDFFKGWRVCLGTDGT
mgnify:CR=1 FL=1